MKPYVLYIIPLSFKILFHSWRKCIEKLHKDLSSLHAKLWIPFFSMCLKIIVHIFQHCIYRIMVILSSFRILLLDSMLCSRSRYIGRIENFICFTPIVYKKFSFTSWLGNKPQWKFLKINENKDTMYAIFNVLLIHFSNSYINKKTENNITEV